MTGAAPARAFESVSWSALAGRSVAVLARLCWPRLRRPTPRVLVHLAWRPTLRPGNGALADGQISASWGRQICDWTNKLPAGTRDNADSILLSAARSGADLEDLDRLAEQIRRHCAEPDTGRDDEGFDDRQVRLETTFAGAGKLDGDLTPACAAALGAVLDALGKPAGPEDLRTRWQRRHDALEEGCRRLIPAR